MKRILLFVLLIFTTVVSGQEPVYYLMKGKALVETGKPDEAIVVLTSAIKLLPEANVYLERAGAYLAKGDYSGAISDFNSANKLEPSSGDYGLARIYGLKGDALTAVYHLESCMRSVYKRSEKEILLDPSFSLIESRPEWRQFWQKGWFNALEKGVNEIEYAVSTGNTTEARRILAELSGIYRGNNENSYANALISIAENKYAESLNSLSSLVVEEPGNEKYIRLFAKAQELSGNYAGASSSYTKLDYFFTSAGQKNLSSYSSTILICLLNQYLLDCSPPLRLSGFFSRFYRQRKNFNFFFSISEFTP